MKKLGNKKKVFISLCAAALTVTASISTVSAFNAEPVLNGTARLQAVSTQNSDGSYTVTQDVAWQENGATHGLQAGDVIGIRENSGGNKRAIQYDGNIRAEHYGYRDYQKYPSTDNQTGKERVYAKTRATMTYKQNGVTKTVYVDSYSRARYEVAGISKIDSGRKWNWQMPGQTYWSEAYTGWISFSLARDYQARTYWGTK